MSKIRILTGIKPTASQLHIGNYFWAIKPIIDLAEENLDSEIFFFLASMHAFTTLHDGNTIRENGTNLVKLYIACGADPERFFIFDPRKVPWHAQLGRVLTCLTNMWYMERMHAYKDALQKWKANEISVWSFCYPILQAADILLYDANIVPVGKDQKQHVEFVRDLAQKVNNKYWEIFVIPDVKIQEKVATINWIDGRKMSKSYNNFIGLLDDEKLVSKRIKQISTATLWVDEAKNPDECNVYNIMKLFLTSDEDVEMRKKYKAGWLSYKYAKDILFEKLRDFLQKIQQKYNEIPDSEVEKILNKNNKKANELAEKKIQEVYKKIGFIL